MPLVLPSFSLTIYTDFFHSAKKDDCQTKEKQNTHTNRSVSSQSEGRTLIVSSWLHTPPLGSISVERRWLLQLARRGSHVHLSFECMVIVAMMDLHPTKPTEKGRIAVLPEEIGVPGPLASGLSKRPKETSDGARIGSLLSLWSCSLSLGSVLREGGKVWRRTELEKRQPDLLLEHLETTARLLVCSREKIEYSGPQNTARLHQAWTTVILSSSPSNPSEQPVSETLS